MTMSFAVRLQNAIADRQDERGAAMAEYGLLLALVALAAIVIIATFGETLRDSFDTTNQTFVDNLPDTFNGPAGPATP